ncbi:hypothetical protein PHLGIDRAFT_110071 [Phlebiopsis gigantea 11061_1 CR5-6]|uniref:P-loop containing nucleoside triphosphate hydrolase protein n=1 Tax=Phlebiopsis gigantea (strain 11061_1 CR5-6) TaxID=745531 RepID=A0A0C3S6F5_PHLG1|nr:hypothetical protein PHLGIDRAFT_110071 [Phlebiopsis gigantea 11061_1 CR5-6]
MDSLPQVKHMSEHVLRQLALHRERQAGRSAIPPLFVAVQGPQGSGKTFLTTRLRDALIASPHSLSVVVLSIDDLYLPHDQLVAVAKAYPENRLLQGRGQPGTHDVKLGNEIIARLKRSNEQAHRDDPINIPRFDKSLFGGEGDRVKGTSVTGPVDVVVFEGWCVGFYPTSQEEIDRRFELPVPSLSADFFSARNFRKKDIHEINERLGEFPNWWSYFDTFIQIKPVENHPYDYIYTWRLQQEHNMKSANGGKGMTDEQVEKFVDRYIPGYVFFGDGITKGGLDTAGNVVQPPWVGRGLCLQIGESREVLTVNKF